MKKLAIATFVLITQLLMSCSVEEEITTYEEYKSTITNVEYSQLDYEIVELINAYRISKGLNTLTILKEASKEAISHNQYMINQGTASHDFFHLRSQNLKNEVNAQNVSENVGYGYSSAQSLVNAWLNSPSHKQNIDNPDFTDFGISSKKDEIGSTYVTNIFVKL